MAIALTNPSPQYPSIGWVQRGGSTNPLTDEGCQFEQVPLSEAEWANGERHPPEVVEACRSVLAKHQDAAHAFRERFVRRMVLSGAGVAPVEGEAKPSWMSAAKHAAGAAGVEVELPLEALPEVMQAPLRTVLVAAAPGALPKDLAVPIITQDPSVPLEAPGWTEVKLPVPVSFGRYHAILAEEFENEYAWSFGISAASYHPAEPDRVRLVNTEDEVVASRPTIPDIPRAMAPPTAPNRPRINEEVRPIFSLREKLGDVEIGLDHYNGVVTYVGSEMRGQRGLGLWSKLVNQESRRDRSESIGDFRFTNLDQSP